MNMISNTKNKIFLVTLFLVFFAGFAGYFTVRSYMARDFFGGDLHNLRLPDSYSFNIKNFKNETAFYSKLFESSLADSLNNPKHFIYNLLSEKGKLALEKMVSGEGTERDKNTFLYEFNISVIDSNIIWPNELLNKLGINEIDLKTFNYSKQNLHIIQKAFPEETEITFFQSPSFLQSIWNIPSIAKMYFTIKDPKRYTPISNIYIHTMQFYLFERPDRILVGIFFISIFFGLSSLLMTLLAYEIVGSLFWAVLAAFLFQTSMAVLCSSYMLFSLPYVFVNIFSFSAYISYLHFKKTGKKVWLAVFAGLGIMCPWVREFSAAVPFIVFATEILSFGRKRSHAVLLICIPLMLHSIAPSFLPKILGLNQGDVYSVFSMEKTKFHYQVNLNFHWDIMGNVFVQIAPVIWILTLWSLISWTSRNNVIKYKKLSKALLGTLILSAVAFIYSFYFANRGVEHFVYLKHGLFLVLFFVFLCLLSFKFNSFLPVYFGIMMLPSIRMGVAEVHIAFSIPPLIIIIVLWLRNLWLYITGFSTGTRKKIYVGAFIALLTLGIIDNFMNVMSCSVVQKSLVKTTKEAALWIKSNIPRHSAILTNYFNFVDMYYYSGYHFDPYESVENCPLGPTRVIHTDEEFKKFIVNNYGVREIYFIAAEHIFFSNLEGYHSHKFVRNPAGKLEEKAMFRTNPIYYYADPFKYFTQRYWVSFPGYMDWGTDYWWDNTPRMFQRFVNCEYTVYKLTDPNVLKESTLNDITLTR